MSCHCQGLIGQREPNRRNRAVTYGEGAQLAEIGVATHVRGCGEDARTCAIFRISPDATLFTGPIYAIFRTNPSTTLSTGPFCAIFRISPGVTLSTDPFCAIFRTSTSATLIPGPFCAIFRISLDTALPRCTVYLINNVHSTPVFHLHAPQLVFDILITNPDFGSHQGTHSGPLGLMLRYEPHEACLYGPIPGNIL